MKKAIGIPNERFRFWESLIETMNKKTDLFSKITTISKQQCIETGYGKTGISLIIAGAGPNIPGWVELRINIKGGKSKSENIYNNILDKKSIIEAEYGESLIWDSEDRKKTYMDKNRITYRIKSFINEKGSLNSDKYTSLHDMIIDKVIRFDRVFSKYIK
jgi:hypothetical protein